MTRSKLFLSPIEKYKTLKSNQKLKEEEDFQKVEEGYQMEEVHFVFALVVAGILRNNK